MAANYNKFLILELLPYPSPSGRLGGASYCISFSAFCALGFPGLNFNACSKHFFAFVLSPFNKYASPISFQAMMMFGNSFV